MRSRFSAPLLIPAVSLLCMIAGCSSDEVTPPEPGPVWLTFKLPETPALLTNEVNDLHADQSGRVWIASDSGANTYYRGSWGAFHDSLRYNAGGGTRYKVNTIESGKNATIWFGLDGGGVRRYREGSSTSVWTTYNSELTYPVVQSISADKVVNGDVWAATTFGVNRWIPATDPEFGSWTPYTGMAYVPSNQVYASAICPTDNTVWFGTQNGFSYYNDAIGDWTPNIALPPEYNYRIQDMAFDLAGTVWLAKLVGVTSFNRESGVWTHYTNENTGGKLPTGSINAVTTDYGTTRWFGTDQGLIRLSDTTWTTFTTSTNPEIPSNVITALTYDNLGNLWIGTMNGIAVFNPEGTRF